MKSWLFNHMAMGKLVCPDQIDKTVHVLLSVSQYSNAYVIFFHFLYVERASQSLGPLRYALNSPVKSPASKRSIYKGDDYSSAGIENIYLEVLNEHLYFSSIYMYCRIEWCRKKKWCLMPSISEILMLYVT